nr:MULTISPECIES: polysaccharide lyase family 8 super-sandwich domain-containing protein [Microbacteriaceae]
MMRHHNRRRSSLGKIALCGEPSPIEAHGGPTPLDCLPNAVVAVEPHPGQLVPEQSGEVLDENQGWRMRRLARAHEARWFWPGLHREGRHPLVRVAGASKNIRPAVDFVGSLRSSSGRSGVAAQRLDAASSTLVAQKAWFLFDDEVVAVGAGVTATGQTGTGWDGKTRHVETVIDQRTVSLANQTVVVDGAAAATTVGTPQNFTDPAWAHISGPTGSVGYTMPRAAPLTVLREHRTGPGTP